jgi:hypothetical protein
LVKIIHGGTRWRRKANVAKTHVIGLGKPQHMVISTRRTKRYSVVGPLDDFEAPCHIEVDHLVEVSCRAQLDVAQRAWNERS